MSIRIIGAGGLVADGIASKAARLDDAVLGNVAVPTSSVVADGADAVDAAELLVARHSGTVAVRSAFAAEDRDDKSLAGHFDSFLHIELSVDAISDAIERVRSSGTEEYRRDVLVMDMVNAGHAGVAFTEPGWLDDLVNHTSGLGDALLSGEEAGEALLLDRRRRDADSAPWQTRLAELLQRTRECFGDESWDIEFADDGTTCWLLQIRRITSAPVRNEWFTLANHREILPDPPSVFMTSLIEEASPELSGPLGILSGAAHGRRFIEVFDRRPYLNLSLLTDFLRNLGLPTSLVADSLGGSDGDAAPVDPLQLVRQIPQLGQLGIRQLSAARTANKVAATLAAVRPSSGDRFAPIIDQAADSYVALVDQMASLATAMAVPVSIVGKLGTLDHHLRHQRTAATQMLDGLYDLAAMARGNEAQQRSLADGVVPEDPAFGRAWSSWLDQHGQRGVFESDMARPRYREDPTTMLNTIARLARAERPQSVETSSAKSMLSAPIWLFARGPMQAREALRADAMRAFDQHRQDILRCAEAAVSRGDLPAVDDVWMLTVDELRALDAGASFDGDFMSERRADFARAAAINAPDLRRRFGDLEAGTWEDGVLHGLPLTTGRCDGTAWVLTEPADELPAELQHLPSEKIVLIARSVDAGWVPLFGQIGGVAVDIGGDLSHGSIVLRELGLPAITNTRHGTEAITTGDAVRLDAREGTIHFDS